MPAGRIANVMDFPFRVSEVTEGAARLLVPDVPRRKGPGTAGPVPFYNPTMVVNRDISGLVLRGWPCPLRSVLDGLAATGAWGIRMRLEAMRGDVVFNDRSAAARDLIRENLQRNEIDGEVSAVDLRDPLKMGPFDFVDLDPFGSPRPFLDGLLDATPTPSGFGITATDTAVLAGTYPATCVRRYGARSLRCPQGAEIGLRILLGSVARLAAARGHSIRPMLSFAAEHFLRVHVTVGPSTEPAPLGHVLRLPGGEFRDASANVAGAIGPMWMGPMMDADFVRGLRPTNWTAPTAARLLATLQGEAGLLPFFVTTDELAARERGSPPRMDRLIDGLRAMGYRAARTHFHPRGIRTDAPFGDVVRAFRDRMPTGSTDGSGPAS
ncbi:MAG: hypothetical protein L3J78_00300 [Thermoplasmata archaeon]|nr:hypothetical protein [Thermoplasmata archaeon]